MSAAGPPQDARPLGGAARSAVRGEHTSTLVHDLAHARSGDKGNTSNVAVIAYDDDAWERIRAQLTSERVMAAYAHIAKGPITRYEVPNLRALNFVIENALAGGVTRSLRLDPHGKTLSSIVLGIELSDD